jgi:hypothetical protein
MSTRQTTAAVLGLLAGAAGFGILQLVGHLLYVRLWGDFLPALVGTVLVFGAAGLYAGWILGMLVYSAVRGPEDEGGAAA